MSPRLTRSARLAVATAALTGAACRGGEAARVLAPPVTPVTVTINNASVAVSIAATNASRAQGLMGVTRMAADSGKLFVFSDDRPRGFWMKDTPVPLSIAYLDANRKIIYLADMAPNTTTVYGGLNAGSMRYALEVNQGWFAAHAVNVGMSATFTLPTGLVVEPDQ